MNIFERFQSDVLAESPIKYMGLTLYPVLMKDIFTFNKTAGVVMINPLDFNDPKVASMSYLELIINLSAMQEDFKENLMSFLKLVFHVEDTDLKVTVEKDGKQNLYFLWISQKKDKVTKENIWEKISASKFTKLKDLICFQNGLEVLDLGQNQDIIRTKRALARQATLDGAPTVNDQIYSVSCVTGVDVKIIMNTWTINRFNEMLKACDRIIHYKIYRSAEMSGMVTFKNGIPVKSWLKSEDNSEGKMKTLAEASNAFGRSRKIDKLIKFIDNNIKIFKGGNVQCKIVIAKVYTFKAYMILNFIQLELMNYFSNQDILQNQTSQQVQT